MPAGFFVPWKLMASLSNSLSVIATQVIPSPCYPLPGQGPPFPQEHLYAHWALLQWCCRLIKLQTLNSAACKNLQWLVPLIFPSMVLRKCFSCAVNCLSLSLSIPWSGLPLPPALVFSLSPKSHICTSCLALCGLFSPFSLAIVLSVLRWISWVFGTIWYLSSCVLRSR